MLLNLELSQFDPEKSSNLKKKMNRFVGLVKIVKDFYIVADYWDIFLLLYTATIYIYYYSMADTEFYNKVFIQLNVNITRQIISFYTKDLKIEKYLNSSRD